MAQPPHGPGSPGPGSRPDDDVWAPPTPGWAPPDASWGARPGYPVQGWSPAAVDAPPPGPRRGRLLALLALLGALLLALALVVVVLPGSDDEGDATASSDGPTADAGAADPGAAEDLRALVPTLSAFVEEQEGAEFLRPVEVELLDDEAFRARLLEDGEEDVEEALGADATLTALGLVGPDVDVAAEFEELLGDGVVGFYDPETDELVVRGADSGPSVRATLVHELTHALQDQLYDLDRPELDDAPDESGYGLVTVAEGDAERVQSAYVDTFDAEERRAYEQEQLSGEIPDVPLVLLRLLVEPYLVGPPFVEEVLEARGREGLAEAFRNPPATTEQLLHPAAYLRGEGALPVAPPTADGEVLDDGVLGESGLVLLFGEGSDAAEGWGGDRYVTWRGDGQVCTRIAYRGDTPADTAEVRRALQDGATAGTTVEVEQEGEGESPLVATSCARDEVQ